MSDIDKDINTLTDTCQLLDGWHGDGTAWTEFDESCRKRCSELLQKLVTQKERQAQSASNAKMVQEEVERALQRVLSEGDVTYAETIGALELVKAATINRYYRIESVEP